MNSPAVSEKGRLTEWLSNTSTLAFAVFAIAASFSTYFCMYAFRKPFSAAKFEGLTFFSTDVELKTALVISQIIGYALSKYIGIKVCSEVSSAQRAMLLLSLIFAAELSLILFGVLPGSWKFMAIFLNGLPLGMVWGLVVLYLEGRKISEVLLAGLSCAFILASGVVKNVGQWLMGDFGVSEGWMPAATGGLFFLPFLVSVWLLNQLPPPDTRDEAARSHRQPMFGATRVDFFKRFFWGLLMLLVAYFFLTAYRDFRDNYQPEIFTELGYQYENNKTIITRAELIVAFGVMFLLSLLFLIRNNRWGLIGTYVVMTSGVMLLSVSTWLLQAGVLNGFWWMVLVGLGSYMAYVPYGSVLFDRLIASTHVVGTAVFAIYLMDAIGYTGSVVIQIFRDVVYRSGSSSSSSSRLEFFVDFSFAMSAIGTVLLVASCVYFLVRNRDTDQTSDTNEPLD